MNRSVCSFRFSAGRRPSPSSAAASVVRALQQQLERRHHACLLTDGRFAGYCGWLLTSREIGEKWLNGEAELSSVPDRLADTVACTIVFCPDRRHVLPLIREARDRKPRPAGRVQAQPQRRRQKGRGPQHGFRRYGRLSPRRSCGPVWNAQAWAAPASALLNRVAILRRQLEVGSVGKSPRRLQLC